MSMRKVVCSSSQLGQFSSIYETINTEPDNRDLVLVCGGVKLSYHQAIVFQHSTFLSSLAKNCSNLNEVVVTLDGVNPVVLRILMDCIYSGKCDKVPGEVLFEVEKVHQMLGFNIYFNAETLNGDDASGGGEKKNPEVSMKTEAASSSNYHPPAPDESQNLDSSNLAKSDAQLSCIYCKSATSFGSPSVFLQHLSSKHFRKQLTEKYGMNDFVPYQPCVCCQKPQKNAAANLIHVGASHKKVVQFLPEDLKQIINGSEKNRKPERSSQMESAPGSINNENESVEMNLKGIKELLAGKGEESSERENYEEMTEGQFQHHSSYLKQEIPENYYGGNETETFAPINALDFKQEALGENLLPNGSLNRPAPPIASDNGTMAPNQPRLPNGSMLPNGLLNGSMPPTGPMISNGYMPPNGPMAPNGPMPPNGHLPPNGPMPPNIPMYLNGPPPSNGPMFPNGPIPSNGPMFPNGPMPPQGPLPPNGPMLPNGSFLPPAMPNRFFEELQPLLPNAEYSPSVAPQGNFNLKQEKLPPNRDSLNEKINSNISTPSSSTPSSNANSSSSDNSSETGMRCTTCKDSKVFASRSSLLQHGAMNHFRKFLVQKYLAAFVPGQKCDDCGKEQNSSTSYLMHIGARHERVLEFFPEEMIIMIKNYRKKSSKVKKRKGVKGKINHLEKKTNIKDKKRKIKEDRLMNDEKPPSIDSPLHGIRCTICQSDKVFPSKSSFMQHLSVKHFRRSITEKYLGNFKPGHPCDKCQKPQKNAQTFMIHIGAFHKKVLGFLSDEMNRSIESMESTKNRKFKSLI